MTEVSNKPDSGMNLIYLGDSNDEVTDKLIGLAEFYLLENSDMKKLGRRVSFIIAECFQNVIRHGDPSEQDSSAFLNLNDYFQIQIIENDIRIYSKNVIANEGIEQLDEQILQLNSMSKDELKVLWRKLITAGGLSQKGGAGLGMIEIARKCGFPLQKKFVDRGDGSSDFYLGILMSKTSEDTTKTEREEFAMEEQYKKCKENGILVSYSGGFSSDISTFLIELIHTNLISDQSLDSGLVQLVIITIEMIQNISKHGVEINGQKTGSFAIIEHDSKRSISCSNYISRENGDNLNEALVRLKNTPLDDLKEMRKKKIFEGELDEKGNGNLGLIEMAIFSKKDFDFEFVEVDESHLIFSIKVNTNYL